MKRYCYPWLGLCLAVASWIPSSFAAFQAPMARNTSVSATFDRQSIPPEVTIWRRLSSGFDDENPKRWLANTLVCLSDSDSSNGACATRPVWDEFFIFSPDHIQLKFTLDGSSIFETLTIRGIRHTARLGTDTWCDVPSWNAVRCRAPNNMTGAQFTFTVPQAQLAKLTQPGVWRAALKQQLMLWGETPTPLAPWQAEITITVTDNKNHQIYFPAFPTSTPVVNLNLNNRPGTQNNRSASGRTALDMCLYDGSNSASNYTALLFEDEGMSASSRPEGDFSVYRRGAEKSAAQDRLDYRILIVNPTTGATEQAKNGVVMQWHDTNRRNILRQVVLPGVPGVSLCVPVPITLVTPEVRLAEKTAGHYTGKLRITYMPMTQTSSQ